MTTLHDVAHQMRLVLPDDPPHDLVLDGKRRYFGKRKKSWYRLREMRTRGGSNVVVGAFGNFSASKGGQWKVDVDWKGISAEERQALQAQRELASAAERAARAREAAEAELSAAELWRRASPAGTSAYLQRKGVDGEGCRYLPDGSIVVPLLRYDLPRAQALKALQRIYPGPRTHARTGEELPGKVFTRGFSKPRCALRLGPGVVELGEPILVAEGYATALTLRMASARALTVFMALDAGNLVHVAGMLRELYPHHRLLLCADDDWRTDGNPGRAKAKEAAKAIDRCDIVWPVFGTGRGAKDTDFNDLHARQGLAAVQRQLETALQAMRRWRDG
jgi:putative DNA primase/helicase